MRGEGKGLRGELFGGFLLGGGEELEGKGKKERSFQPLYESQNGSREQ